jgi:hypothetical protein
MNAGPPATMRAMVLDRPGAPLRAATLPVPTPGTGELLLKVRDGRDSCFFRQNEVKLMI